MKGKKIIWIGFICICVYATMITVLSVKQYYKENKTVAQIENHKLTRTQVMDKIINDYWDDTISNMADELIIKDEADKLKITVSPDEIGKETMLLEETEHKNININDTKQKEMVSFRILTKKLAQKYIVDDATIKAFLTERNGDIGNRTFHVLMYESSDHTLLTKMAEDAKTLNAEKLEQKYSIKFKVDDLTLEHNPFKLPLDELVMGSVQHVQNGSSHALTIVNGIDTIKIDDKNYQQYKDNILNVFLSSEYYQLKTNLVQFLVDKNHINVYQS